MPPPRDLRRSPYLHRTAPSRRDSAVVNVDAVDQIRDWVQAAEKVVVLTGAGISTDSGIPDFRGPNGIWTKNPAAEKASTLQHYLADRTVRVTAWRNRVESPTWHAQPNAGHRAIAELERLGKLHGLITQNVDGLHQQAGNSPEKVIEVHGTMRWTMCWSCGDRLPMQETLERVRAGEEDPPCLVCGGILKSDTISFGQSLVPEVIDRAMQVSEECDVFLAVGSSLQVFPAANALPRARASGARVVIINGEPTKMDGYADVVIVGSISDILPLAIPS